MVVGYSRYPHAGLFLIRTRFELEEIKDEKKAAAVIKMRCVKAIARKGKVRAKLCLADALQAHATFVRSHIVLEFV